MLFRSEDLLTDTQAIIYTAAAMTGSLKGHIFEEEVTFRLLYGTTRGRTQTRIVERKFEPLYIRDQLFELIEEIKDQGETSKIPEWQEVTPNYAGCDKYGGCPFINDCKKAAQVPTTEIISTAPGKDFITQMRDKAEGQYLNRTGEQYINANPPDGLPDGEDLPGDEKPKKKQKTFKWNGLTLSQMKKQDLLDCLSELIASLNSEQFAYDLVKKNSIKDYDNVHLSLKERVIGSLFDKVIKHKLLTNSFKIALCLSKKFIIKDNSSSI